MPLAETAKLSPRNTLFRRQYQYLLSRIGLEPAHLFQFAKKKRPARGLKTPKTHENAGNAENGGKLRERQCQRRRTEVSFSAVNVWRLVLNRSPRFSCVPGVPGVPGVSNGRAGPFLRDPYLISPTLRSMARNFCRRCWRSSERRIKFADQQRIVT